MRELATTAFSLDGTDSDNSDQYAVIIRPPKEIDDEPRNLSERLLTGLHGHGSLSIEATSDGANVTLQIVVEDRPTARTVARQARAELDADAEIVPATVPIDSDDALAAATFRYEKDAIYPPTTERTDEGDVGPLHHVLDTLADEDVRGVYQVTATPIEGDWSSRRARALPAPITHERDIESEAKRAGAAVVPLAGLSLFLSPWPIATSLCVSLGLLVAATVGEGVRLPQRRTAEDIAHETREQAKDAHGARSSKAKKAKQAADAVVEQGDAPGWRLALRVVVGASNGAAATEHCKRLATQVEQAFSSSVTGQTLVASSGQDARTTLDAVRARQPSRPTPVERLRQLWAHGTRSAMRGGSFVVGSMGYFPDAEGGGADAREFAASGAASTALPDGAPAFDPDDRGTSPEYALQSTSEIVTERHSALGDVGIKVEGETPEEVGVYAGEYPRALVETADGQTYLGYVESGGRVRELAIDDDQLDQHIFISGASGCGKSTLAQSIALQHAHAGRGMCAIDPHNDFVDDLRRRLPEDRQDDVILVDPEPGGDVERMATMNFLDVEREADDDDYEEAINAAVSDLVGVLKQGADNIGDRMEDCVRTVARGMIRSERDFSLVDMQVLVTDDQQREAFAERMHREGYTHLARSAETIADLSDDDLAPVARLLNSWVMSPTSRRIIEHTESSFSFTDAVAEDKIVLVRNDLSDDDLARQVATTVYRGVMRAAEDRPQNERATYPMLIDEVDDIYSDEMGLGDDLGNARKYGVSLTLLTQLPGRLKPIQAELETNCKTFVAFAAPSPTQARSIASMFDCEQSLVGSLGDYRALVQLDLDGERQGPFKMASSAPMPPIRSESAAISAIDEPALEKYGVDVSGDGGATAVIPSTDGGTDAIAAHEDTLKAFLTAAAESDDLVEGEQYKFVHKGSSRERLRINPSRSIEVLEEYEPDEVDDVLEASRELVDGPNSFVTNHRQNSPPAGRCSGIDLTRVSGVDRGSFIDE